MRCRVSGKAEREEFSANARRCEGRIHHGKHQWDEEDNKGNEWMGFLLRCMKSLIVELLKFEMRDEMMWQEIKYGQM